MALGASGPPASRGLDVPGDVSVVGFDDSRLIQFLDPPLTTVRQPVQSMGGPRSPRSPTPSTASPVPSHEYLFAPELVLRAIHRPGDALTA